MIVSAERAEDRVVLSVADDGPGIPPGILGRVLEPFVTSTSAHGHDSSGLGLAVVDEVARAHGGQVLITSSPAGTTAALDLPVAGPAG